MSKGFTLLEIIVVVGIISILSIMAANAFPLVRNHQILITDAGIIQSALRKAQQLAVNEVREDCINNSSVSVSEEKRCSDVGIAFKGNQLIMFADTTGSDTKYETTDYSIQEYTLRSNVVDATTGVPLSTWHSLIYTSNPPEVSLYRYDGSGTTEPASTEITLKSGELTRTLKIFRYGHIETN